MRHKLLLPGHRTHSVPITYFYSFLLIFSYGHGLLLAWEDDPKIDSLGEVKEVPKSLSVVECVYTGVYTGVNMCKVEWSCWKD